MQNWNLKRKSLLSKNKRFVLSGANDFLGNQWIFKIDLIALKIYYD